MADVDYEKGQYTIGTEPSEQKTAAIGEAADLYGSVEAAEQYGYVERGYVVSISSRSLTLTNPPQTEISTHPVHRPGWYYWNRSLPRYR